MLKLQQQQQLQLHPAATMYLSFLPIVEDNLSIFIIRIFWLCLLYYSFSTSTNTFVLYKKVNKAFQI